MPYFFDYVVDNIQSSLFVFVIEMSTEEHDMCKMDIKKDIFFETIHVAFDDAISHIQTS